MSSTWMFSFAGLSFSSQYAIYVDQNIFVPFELIFLVNILIYLIFHLKNRSVKLTASVKDKIRKKMVRTKFQVM